MGSICVLKTEPKTRATSEQMKRRHRLGFEHCEQRCLMTVNFEYHAIASVETIGEVTSADLDGDGDPDIIVGSESGVVFHENLGSFENFASHRIGSGTVTEVQPIDMDGDEDLDLYVGFNNGRYAWYEQLTPGNFTDTSLSTFPFEAFGDIDNDGDVDAISLVELEFAWHETTGAELGVGPRRELDIASALDHLHNTPPLGYEVELVDLNGDDNLDILATPPRFRQGEIYWHENEDGFGRFGRQQTIAEPALYGSSLGDLDHDGDMDLLLAKGDSPGKTVWLENNGIGEFHEHPLLEVHHINVELHDLDADGLDDLVSLENRWMPWNKLRMRWHTRNAEQVSFGETQSPIKQGSENRSMFVHDLDQDGDLDILSTSSDEIGWFESDAAETRQRLAADSNGDGIIDMTDFLVLANHFGATKADRSTGDFNEDGVVSFLDFVVLAHHFGAKHETD